MLKILLVALVMTLILGSIALSLSMTSKTIEPVKDENIKVCFEYSLDGNKEYMCREYPSDLLNRCEYNRYGEPSNCKNVLESSINSDIKNWYTNSLPNSIKASVELKDIQIVSTNEPTVEKMIDCPFDFYTEVFAC